MAQETIQIIIEYIDKNRRKVSEGMKNLTLNMRRFTTTMLSVMFFGMAISRMFKSWLQPAMDAFGIFELWNAMLTTVFIPIMELIAPILTGIMEFFMNLPEPVKLAIGAIAVVASVFGSLLALLAPIGLGLQGIAVALGSFGITIGLGALAIVFAKIIIIIGLVVAAVALLKRAWDTNFLGIRDVTMNAINNIITAIGNLQKRWVDVWNKIFEILFNIWSKIKPILQFIGDKIEWLVGLIVGLINGVRSVVHNLTEGVMGLFGGGRVENVGDFVVAGGRVLKTHPQDTIIGTKNPGGIGGSTIISPTINISEVIIREDGDYDKFRRTITDEIVNDLNALVRR